MSWNLLWRAFKCFIRSEHLWVESPGGRLRACSCCYRREYLFFKGHGGRGRWVERWYEHKYPLDADPMKDPTAINVDGYTYKLGELREFNQLMGRIAGTGQSVEGKSHQASG